jgi:REP element-mobilizing transposase RayT
MSRSDLNGYEQRSITAREMWQQPEPLLLWGGEFWERSSDVGTAGSVSTDAIEQYTERTEHT